MPLHSGKRVTNVLHALISSVYDVVYCALFRSNLSNSQRLSVNRTVSMKVLIQCSLYRYRCVYEGDSVQIYICVYKGDSVQTDVCMKVIPFIMSFHPQQTCLFCSVAVYGCQKPQFLLTSYGATPCKKLVFAASKPLCEFELIRLIRDCNHQGLKNRKNIDEIVCFTADLKQ